jgi:hypothetical protein
MTFNPPEEERGLAPWLETIGLRMLPFLAVAAALYLFLVYGALVALMAIFVFLLVWYTGTLIYRVIKKSRNSKKNRTGF